MRSELIQRKHKHRSKPCLNQAVMLRREADRDKEHQPVCLPLLPALSPVKMCISSTLSFRTLTLKRLKAKSALSILQFRYLKCNNPTYKV